MPGRAFDEHWIEVMEAAQFDPVGREKVLRFEASIARLPQFECPLKHYFVDGLYVREMFLPAGVAGAGHIHMAPCIMTISLGAVIVDDGEHGPMLLRAPFTRTCAPGTKRAFYALQDTVWSDAYVNADNERDLERIHAKFTAGTQDEYLERIGAARQLEGKP